MVPPPVDVNADAGLCMWPCSESIGWKSSMNTLHEKVGCALDKPMPPCFDNPTLLDHRRHLKFCCQVTDVLFSCADLSKLVYKPVDVSKDSSQVFCTAAVTTAAVFDRPPDCTTPRLSPLIPIPADTPVAILAQLQVFRITDRGAFERIVDAARKFGC